MWNWPKCLTEFSLTREQLVDVGILIGTDFNPDGVKGIGPKTAVKLIKENGNLENVMSKNSEIKISPDPNRIREIFLGAQGDAGIFSELVQT